MAAEKGKHVAKRKRANEVCMLSSRQIICLCTVQFAGGQVCETCRQIGVSHWHTTSMCSSCDEGIKHHCAKEVKKAAKKAKDFEIRKLVKRLKGLRYVVKQSACDM